MGSLYAANDPCSAHKFAPPLSGNLIKFFVSKALRGADNQITITVTAANAKRGKVVLKGPPVTSVDPVLPAPVVLTFDCLQQGETCGGVPITAARAANWVTAGKPASWCHPGHWLGDANVDCVVDATDVLGVGGSPNFKAAFGQAWPSVNYKPSCDTNDDLVIDASDILGDPGIPNSGLKTGFGSAIPNCAPGQLP
jgi:hypothetical protein